ncbi:hypothetical protein [Halomonas sp. CSM-2]|uniref:hypothetical protein n=1 Tax=Halomonas sp. CSM-2 TaxID=1975722 RepID=UPI000A286751|nr:hypothetical protein [Halomonas sp. CSM-2]
MKRHENILASLGGMELDEAIERTRDALTNHLRKPADLSVFGDSKKIDLSLHERFEILELLREMLEARLAVLEIEPGEWRHDESYFNNNE